MPAELPDARGSSKPKAERLAQKKILIMGLPGAGNRSGPMRAGRRTWFETAEEMQTVLDSYMEVHIRVAA